MGWPGPKSQSTGEVVSPMVQQCLLLGLMAFQWMSPKAPNFNIVFVAIPSGWTRPKVPDFKFGSIPKSFGRLGQKLQIKTFDTLPYASA